MVNPLRARNPDPLWGITNAVKHTLEAMNLPTALRRTAEGVRRVVGTDATAAITLVGRDGQLDPSKYYVAGPLAPVLRSVRPRPAQGVGSWTVAHGEAIYEGDVASGEAVAHPPVRQDRAPVAAYACVPLTTQQGVVGTLFIALPHPFEFTGDVKSSLDAFAMLAARVVELMRLRSEQQAQTAEQMKAVRSLSSQLRNTWQVHDPELQLGPTLRGILRRVRRVIDRDDASASIYVYDETRGFYSGASYGPLHAYMDKYPPRDSGTAAYVMSLGEPLFVGDTHHMPSDVPPLSVEALRHDVRAFANLPLWVGGAKDRTVVGILIVNLLQPFDFDDHRRSVLRLFADEAAIVVQAVRVHRRRLREQAALQVISEAVTGGDLYQVGNVVAQQAVDLAGAYHGTFWSLDPLRRELHLRGYAGPDRSWIPANAVLAVDETSINGYVALTQHEHYAPRVAEDRYHKPWDRDTQSAVCLPLFAQDNLVGTLYISSPHEDGFTPEHRDFLRQLAPHAAIALYNVRLLELEMSQRRRAEAFQAIIEKMHSTVDLEVVAASILEQLAQVIPYRRASLQTIHGDRRKILAAQGFDPTRVRPEHLRNLSQDALVADIVASKAPRILSDARAEYPDWGAGLGTVHSWCGVPLVVDDKVVGFLTLDHSEPRHFTYAAHADLLETFARHAALALRDARRDRELKTLNQSALRLNASQDEETVYRTIVNAVVETLDCDYCTVFVIDPDGMLVSRAAGGRLFAEVPKLRFESGKGLAGWVYGKELSQRVDNTATDVRYVPGPGEHAARPRSMLLSVLREGSRKVGVISADFDRPASFDDNDQRLLDTLAQQAASALENVRHSQQQRVREQKAINDFQGRISAVLPVAEQLENIYAAIEEVAQAGLMDTTNMYIALYDDAKGRITFPLAYQAGERVPTDQKTEGMPYGPRDFGARKGLTEWVIRHKQSLLIPRNFDQWVHQHSDEVVVFKMNTRCWLGAPLLYRDRVLGVIGLQNFEDEGKYDENQRVLLDTIARQAAIAIDNAQLLTRRSAELDALGRFQHAIVEVPSFEQTIDLTATLMRIYGAAKSSMSGLMDTSNMYIALYDQATERIEFPFWYQGGRLVADDEKVPGQPWGPRRLGERKGLTDWVIRHRQPLLISRDFDDWITGQDEVEAFGIGTKCWLGAPMLFGDEMIGVIGLQNFDREGVFDDRHRDLLETIARQAAVAIKTIQLYREAIEAEQKQKDVQQQIANERQRRLDRSAQITQRMAEATDDPGSVLGLIVHAAAEVTDSDFSTVYRYNENTAGFTGGVWLPRGSDVQQVAPDDLPDPDGIAAQVALEQIEVFQAAVPDDEFVGFNWRHNVRAFACLPLIVANPRGPRLTLGVLYVNFHTPHNFSDETREVLRQLAYQAAVAIAHADAQSSSLANEQLAALGTAAATLQHRLSNTINITLPAVMRLRYRTGGDPVTEEILDAIERNTLFANDVIQRMQTPLRNESFVPTRINHLMRDAIQKCVDDQDRFPLVQVVRADASDQYQATDTGKPIIAIVPRLDSDFPTTYASSGRMQEVFRVLVENGIKAINPHAGQVTVSSRLISAGRRQTIEIIVTDTGKGVDEKVISRLFKQPVPRKEFGEGAGLGLWLSYIIVRGHRGHIELVSTAPGQGSTFRVWLPVLDRPPVQPVEEGAVFQ